MVVYTVHWIPDPSLYKGKGKVSDYDCCFSVLCRSISDAMACFEWVFHHDCPKIKKCSIEDGSVTCKRQKIDSRSFEISYLFMDGIQRPLRLSDVKRSLDSYFPSLYHLDRY